jgi:hypothetical protein
MAGFEVIVRPVIFPSIRPQAPRVLAPEDDPTQGFAEISGGGGQLIDLPYTWSYSMSRSMQQIEQARASDVARVYQEEKDPTTGRKTINRENFIETDVMKAALIRDNKGELQEIQYRPVDKPELPKNVEVLERDLIEWWDGA